MSEGEQGQQGEAQQTTPVEPGWIAPSSDQGEYVDALERVVARYPELGQEEAATAAMATSLESP